MQEIISKCEFEGYRTMQKRPRRNGRGIVDSGIWKETLWKELIIMSSRRFKIKNCCENENGFLACNNIGKLDECLFLTQAEAEQKLKEMDGD